MCRLYPLFVNHLRDRMKLSRHILPLLMVLCILLSCARQAETVEVKPLNPDSVPMMVTHNVRTLISDSGVTQYRITTPVWYVYDGGQNPHWNFPKGAFLEQFDKKFKVVATVRCDSARYNTAEQLWRLDGNVRIQNVEGDLIVTNQMFWDQRWDEVRSDSFVHIEKPDRVIEGYGFRSNQAMTRYRLNKVMAILPIDENRMPGSGAASAAPADSTSN